MDGINQLCIDRHRLDGNSHREAAEQAITTLRTVAVKDRRFSAYIAMAIARAEEIAAGIARRRAGY